MLYNIKRAACCLIDRWALAISWVRWPVHFPISYVFLDSQTCCPKSPSLRKKKKTNYQVKPNEQSKKALYYSQ